MSGESCWGSLRWFLLKVCEVFYAGFCHAVLATDLPCGSQRGFDSSSCWGYAMYSFLCSVRWVWMEVFLIVLVGVLTGSFSGEDVFFLTCESTIGVKEIFTKILSR